MQTTTQIAYPALAEELQRIKRIGILVSGGCDSEVLLRAAADVSGSANTIAFIAVTPFIAKYYTDIVKAATDELNIRLIQVTLDTLQLNSITANTSERCYHCKKAVYSTIKAAAEKQNITILADGTNLNDTTEQRPGLKAAEELNILHPFKTSGMTKTDVRELGRLLNMKDPNRPADSCLATRIPEMTSITPELISLINRIEQSLRPLVKARLRARVSDKQITLEYQAIDKELVKAHGMKLQAIADNNRYTLTFHEST